MSSFFPVRQSSVSLAYESSHWPSDSLLPAMRTSFSMVPSAFRILILMLLCQPLPCMLTTDNEKVLGCCLCY